MNTSLLKTTKVRDATRSLMLLLLLAYLMAYILPSDLRPLLIPDESRYAEVPREMITSGDWVVPHLIDLRYFEKPPLGYWLTAISIRLFGENNFAVRLSSALSIGITAWLIWLLLIRSGYRKRNALLAAAIFLTLLEVFVVGTLSILDSPFTLFISGGMVLFYLASNIRENLIQQRYYLSASGVMFGLAFLTKGFLAFALPGIVLLPFILIVKQYNLLWRSAWVVLFAVLIVLPWAIAIHLREADFWHYFIWEEHIRRFLSNNAQHEAPFSFYFVALPAMAFPWFSFVPAAIAGYYSKIQNKNLLWFLLLWFGMPLLFFSISKGKLATYILPCLIPLAILISTGLVKYLQTGKRRWFMLGSIINAIVLSIALVALLYNKYASTTTSLYSDNETLKFIALASSLFIAVLAFFSTVFMHSVYKRLIIILCAVGLLLPVINYSIPDSELAIKSPNFIFKDITKKINKNTILVSDANVVRAVAWVFKRSDIYLLFPGELTYGLGYPDDTKKLLGIVGLKKLFTKQRAGEIKNDIAIFCEEPCTQELKEIIGEHKEKWSNSEYTVWIVRHEQ